MSPYEILGVRPAATLDEAEAAYRALLRECHPDLHAHAGPEAVAWAERRTRELNAAIHTLRSDARIFVGTAGEPFADADWFAPPDPHRCTITCVLCGIEIDDPGEYRVHLVLDHALAKRMRRRRTRAARTPILAYVPAPMFWALVLLVVYGVTVFGTLGDSPVAIAGWWLGILAYLVFLPFAYRADRHRRRF
jgi:hypothetical protein